MAISTITYAADKIKSTWAHLETIMPATYNELNRVVKELVTNNNNTISTVLATVYPVGAIYISANATSPATLFGGTWEQIKDRFLLSAGGSHTAGATGGEETHTLTSDEMPSHNHNISSAYRQEYGNGGYESGFQPRNVYNAGNPRPQAVAYAGGGQAHNNMPPYLVVYMWKRIA